MTDSIPDDADLPDETTDRNGALQPDPAPPSEAEVRDEQQIVDLQGGDAVGGSPD